MMTALLCIAVIILCFQELLRFLFREAKIHNAVIFFDECEPLFESRDNRPNPSLALMLTEVQNYFLSLSDNTLMNVC